LVAVSGLVRVSDVMSATMVSLYLMSSLPVRGFPQEISIGHGGCLLAHIASDVCSDEPFWLVDMELKIVIDPSLALWEIVMLKFIIRFFVLFVNSNIGVVS